MDTNTVIQVDCLKKSFGSVEVLKDVSFTVQKGETIAVIGPSGGGKSTMLRCLIDLEKADGGSIRLGENYLMKDGVYEKDAGNACRNMGMVFQSFNLFPHLSVMDNLILAPVNVNGVDKKTAIEEAHQLLEKVGLADKAAAKPSMLSGGQKQRVAIARALMMHPEVLLFDEPTSALDPQLTGEVLDVMKDLAHENMTMVVVTHEMGFAREAADRILFMHSGYIVESGAPEKLLYEPENEVLRQFLKKVL